MKLGTGRLGKGQWDWEIGNWKRAVGSGKRAVARVGRWQWGLGSGESSNIYSSIQ